MKRVPSPNEYRFSAWLGWAGFATAAFGLVSVKLKVAFQAITQQSAALHINVENIPILLKIDPEFAENAQHSSLTTTATQVSTTITDLSNSEQVWISGLAITFCLFATASVIYLALWLVKTTSAKAFSRDTEKLLITAIVLALISFALWQISPLVLQLSRDTALFENTTGRQDTAPSYVYSAFIIGAVSLISTYGLLRNRGLDLEQDTEGLV